MKVITRRGFSLFFGSSFATLLSSKAKAEQHYKKAITVIKLKGHYNKKDLGTWRDMLLDLYFDKDGHKTIYTDTGVDVEITPLDSYHDVPPKTITLIKVGTDTLLPTPQDLNRIRELLFENAAVGIGDFGVEELPISIERFALADPANIIICSTSGEKLV